MSREIKDLEQATGCRLVGGPGGFEVYRLEEGTLRFLGAERTRPQAIAFMRGVLAAWQRQERQEHPEN